MQFKFTFPKIKTTFFRLFFFCCCYIYWCSVSTNENGKTMITISSFEFWIPILARYATFPITIWPNILKPNLQNYMKWHQQDINHTILQLQFWEANWSSWAHLLEPVSRTIWKETSEEAAETKGESKGKGKIHQNYFNY